MNRQNTPRHKVFLIGINKSISQKNILNFFKSLYPSVTNINPAPSKSKSKKNAVLTLESKEEMIAMIAQDSFQFRAAKIYAKPYFKGGKLKRFKSERKKRRFFIRKIPYVLTKIEIFEIFEKFGEVEEVIFVDEVYDGEDGRKVRDGFVLMKDEDIVARLVRQGRIFAKNFEILISQFTKGLTNKELMKKKKGKKIPKVSSSKKKSQQKGCPKFDNKSSDQEFQNKLFEEVSNFDKIHVSQFLDKIQDQSKNLEIPFFERIKRPSWIFPKEIYDHRPIKVSCHYCKKSLICLYEFCSVCDSKFLEYCHGFEDNLRFNRYRW
jgi:RNA recognition motif-containing protein